MSDNEEDTTESSIPNPVPTPRVGLPVRFPNPDNPHSERPIALLSTETLVGQIDQLVENNESFLLDFSQTLAEVDNTLTLADSKMNDNLLNQTIAPNLGDNQTLLEPSKLTEGSSSGNIQSSPQLAEPLSTSDRVVDTIDTDCYKES